MKNHLLQDMRKKVTKDAYKQLILDDSHDLIIERQEYDGFTMPDLANINEVADCLLLNLFDSEYNHQYERQRTPNIYQRVSEWLRAAMYFGYEAYPICEWLVSTKQVADGFIPANKDLIERMQFAEQRHYDYCARTIVNNASADVLRKINRHYRFK